ncbi:MAG: LLM class flavin-dependent oxidoreductase [Pseudomonadales bacterium]|mgnify:CR=1 FL=1|jgi:hypothetical protein|nr:LLM class flavin-dependent oxidoreductase [Pseudomonadales bacterium]MDP6472428.1 LLM class flavin-dependent oxidoreductase [Pseudomonadales bacterium]MDP6828224.1 LLM class flavin-dependent oxidoreductase [Pseudomonadales bacterium]|tara:strand:- start:205 stop:663 length:459 start_codon:yes stop_codon:yes gene_type:complete
MEFGVLHLFKNLVNKTERQIIKEQMELMPAAESLGFDSTWPAEHHFSEYGFCASAQLSLAALATQTIRLRLGTAVVVLPFDHPVKVAEDFAFSRSAQQRTYQPGARMRLPANAIPRLRYRSTDGTIKGIFGTSMCYTHRVEVASRAICVAQN